MKNSEGTSNNLFLDAFVRSEVKSEKHRKGSSSQLRWTPHS